VNLGIALRASCCYLLVGAKILEDLFSAEDLRAYKTLFFRQEKSFQDHL
jgi:hypothetical protein